MRSLAERVRVDHTTVSRIEKGERGLSVDMAQKFAQALNTTVGHLLGIDDAGAATNKVDKAALMEEAAPFALQDAGNDTPISLRRSARDTVEPFLVKSNSLDALGYNPGDVIFVDIGQVAVDALKPAQCVVAQAYSGMTAVTVLRQFIPPALLITNSRRDNAMSLNLDTDDVAIKGVIVGQYTPRN